MNAAKGTCLVVVNVTCMTSSKQSKERLNSYMSVRSIIRSIHYYCLPFSQGRIQDFEMGGENIKQNHNIKYYFNILGIRKKKIK